MHTSVKIALPSRGSFAALQVVFKIDFMELKSTIQVICTHDEKGIPLRHTIPFLQQVRMIHVGDLYELQAINPDTGYVKTFGILNPDDSDTSDFQCSNDELVVTMCMTDTASDAIVTSFKVSDVLGKWALIYE